MTKSEKAVENFNSLNCNQSILSVFGPDYGICENHCMSLGLGFGGGMGKQGKTCGAVTGAYMVIGLWAAKKPGNNNEKKEIANQKIREFNKLFIEGHGVLECEKLLGYNVGVPEENEKIKSLGYFQTRCPKYISASAEILCNILD